MKRPTQRRDRAPAAVKAGPPRGAYRNGIDMTQIRYMLSLTPAERLQRLQQLAQNLSEMRETRRKPRA
jgi:hypothetical protein